MYDKWNKYTHVCQTCDALIESTSKRVVTEITCECGGKCVWLSQEPATITPTNEREQMEVTLNSSSFTTDEQIQALEQLVQNKDAMITSLQNQHANCDYWKNENGRVQSQIIDVINAFYDFETPDFEIIQTLCEIVDYNPKKTINFSGTITFSGSIDVERSELENFDLSSFLQDEISLDTNYGDMILDTFDIDHVEED
jgi:hypothetical protein